MSISNLQEFIDFLYSEEFEGVESFDLEDWPRLDIKLDGDRYNGTITPELAKSLYDFYMDLQRAYAYIKYGSPNLQRLTLEDKKLFSSIEYRIEEGSLKVFGELCDQAKAMFDSLKGLTDGMESAHKRTLYIAIVLALLGGYTVKKHFDYESQVAKAEQGRQQQQIMVEGHMHSVDALLEQSKTAINALSEQDRSRVTGALDKLDDGYGGIIRSVPDADYIDISGAAMDGGDIRDYVDNPQADTEAHILEEELSVEQVSKRRFPRISVRVSDLDDNQFTLGFTFGEITRSSYDKIFDSIKNNTTVMVRFNALLTEEGVLHRGTILAVSQGSRIEVDDNDDMEDEETE
ncbi:hypothetical protein [Halomonas salipaludis]|uniref:Uncharacterized protein n=1 Tax=Halomonas salipaludis TaxID=2032625 RepID=A0A2A2EWL5_9GAMM|nr:hypothetical protein [Halomonas salipaludis]PAU76752.1 hypothetical protein CK498_12275 [Halomonas salipaludis]